MEFSESSPTLPLVDPEVDDFDEVEAVPGPEEPPSLVPLPANALNYTLMNLFSCLFTY